MSVDVEGGCRGRQGGDVGGSGGHVLDREPPGQTPDGIPNGSSKHLWQNFVNRKRKSQLVTKASTASATITCIIGNKF